MRFASKSFLFSRIESFGGRIPLAVATAWLISMGNPSAMAQPKKAAASSTGGAGSAAASAAPPSSSGAFEEQMLAYGALDHIAGDVAATVCSADGVAEAPAVVIFDQAAFSTIQAYEAFVANANIVIGAYETILDGSTGNGGKLTTDLTKRFQELEKMYEGQAEDLKAAPAQRSLGKHLAQEWRDKELNLNVTGPAIGDPFSDLTGLLSAIAISSNTETAGAITIPDSALAVLLARKLKGLPGCKEKAIIYPPLFGKSSVSDYSAADIQADLRELDEVRREAHDQVDEQSAKFIAAHQGQTNITGDPVLTAALADVDGLYDNFMNTLLQVNGTSGVLGSAAVIQGYQLKSLLAGGKAEDARPRDDRHPATPEIAEVKPAFILLASIVASGGTQHVHKTFWTALSTGDKITYSGGAIVNVSLWKANSQAPVYSQELRYRTPFLNLRNPADTEAIDVGDNLDHPKASGKKPKGRKEATRAAAPGVD
jgi:hypothetical protein